MKALMVPLMSILAAAPVSLAASIDRPHVWRPLPSVPDAEGFAAPFAGASGGALILSGGANFPGKKPWEGGQKVWHDYVFVLESVDGAWRKIGRLEHPLAYGISITTSNGVLCLGGSDATRHYAAGFELTWKGGSLRRQDFPSLPKACANMVGALVGTVVYVAGGIESPDSTEALHSFWALDLAARERKWKLLEPWPGSARMLAVAGVHDGAFYLFSGVALRRGADGKPVRSYLRDAFSYTADRGWKKLPNAPRAAAGAPSPAPVLDDRLLLISGDDGSLADFEPKSRHPGFPRNVLSYQTTTGTWTTNGVSPLSRATVPIVRWQNRFVIPNGEVRPGVRTPEVWSFQINDGAILK